MPETSNSLLSTNKSINAWSTNGNQGKPMNYQTLNQWLLGTTNGNLGETIMNL